MIFFIRYLPNSVQWAILNRSFWDDLRRLYMILDNISRCPTILNKLSCSWDCVVGQIPVRDSCTGFCPNMNLSRYTLFVNLKYCTAYRSEISGTCKPGHSPAVKFFKRTFWNRTWKIKFSTSKNLLLKISCGMKFNFQKCSPSFSPVKKKQFFVWISSLFSFSREVDTMLKINNEICDHECIWWNHDIRELWRDRYRTKFTCAKRC